MATAAINNISVYYEVHGEGTPLLLIAGLASDSQSWLPIIQDLARHHRVIIFDNRGVGRTKPSDIDISVDKMADDCIALLQHLEVTSADILGHSMGGFIAQRCAIRYPNSVKKLILAGTSAKNSKRNDTLFTDWAQTLENGIDLKLWFRNIFEWIFTRQFFENKKMLDDALQYAIEYPYPQTKQGNQNQVKAVRDFNCQDDLSGIKSKTLVIAGKEDLLFPVQESENLVATIPQASLVIIDQAAHSIHMENPQAFVRCVLDFL